jgi:hypothetical protein
MDLRRAETVAVTASTTSLEFEWITTPVVIQLRDQHGIEIGGSTIRFGGSVPLPTGTTLTLPITDDAVYPTVAGGYSDGYEAVLIPGRSQLGGVYDLNREVSGFEVLTATTAINFEWITSNVTIRLQDQYGVDIGGSTIRFGGSFPLPTGTTLALPITDEAVYPTLFGGYADGYDASLIAGRGVLGGAFSLFREESNLEVSATTNHIGFEWWTSTVLVRVQDQASVEIPGSKLRIGGSVRVDTGTFVTLPITDNDVYPTIHGSEAAGFEIPVAPGVRWSNRAPTINESLMRVLRREVLTGTTSIVVDWHVVECPLAIRLVGGPEVSGSLFFESPHSTWATGATVWLPITENTVYPDLVGSGANGYTITVRPDAVAPLAGTFQFEMLQSGAFEPASFVIGGNAYSLFRRTNVPPTVDAGPNRTIITSEVPTTTIAGTATDVDSQSLTYRWLRGSTVLFGPASVGATGTAPLVLAGVAGIGIGTHELVLEVSDGVDSSARMHLTVGNSPPVASCSGAGTYQAGVDTVNLGGSVADYDGDSVSWSWWLGALQLASGWVNPAAGGAPSALPMLSLSTGAAAELGLGTHLLQLRLDDGQGQIATCDASVSVVDNQAPRLAPVADRTILWPPNHALVPITITTNAVDAGGGPVVLSATVQSSEDAYKDGAGNTIPDWLEPTVDLLTGRVFLFLRAERSGRGPGRTYTVTITATDGADNRSAATVVVTAPHDRG